MWLSLPSLPSLRDVQNRLYSAQISIGRTLNNHRPAVLFFMTANQFFLVSAANDYFLREAQNPSLCTRRAIPFEGFGALETNQCSNMVEVYERVFNAALNATVVSVVGTVFLELSKVKNWYGSDTLAQVPLECLQKQLPKMATHIMGVAGFDNPPLDPFPNNFQGTCTITVQELILSKGRYDSRNHGARDNTMRPRRDIIFTFLNLNPKTCNDVIDYVNNQAIACHDLARVSQLDAGKAFLVISLTIGGVVVVGGAVLSCIGLAQMAQNCNRNTFFSSGPTPRTREIDMDDLESAPPKYSSNA